MVTGECAGNAKDHCCWIAGKRCPYSEDNTVPGRRWVCGLRREYGNWDDVLASDRYKAVPGAHFAPMGMDCKTWPDITKQQSCGECGLNKLDTSR
jgi:hypothetical protein